MEKLLKPDKLDAEPGVADADKTWTHWKTTFDNFINSYSDRNTLTDAQKLATLTNCVSANVYSYISSATTFDDALGILKDIYIKPKNEVYVRHCVATRKQQDGESIDQYMHALDVLSKECTFVPVNAAEYRDEYVRDSFIRGVQSKEIRQRLLEECGDRKTTFTKARTLELAFMNNLQINDKSYIAAIPENTSNELVGPSRAMTASPFCAALNFPRPEVSNNTSHVRPNPLCYFCGYKSHNRSACPARDATCYNCGKQGHLAKVCKSGGRFAQNNKAKSDRPTSAGMIPATLSDAIIDSKVNGYCIKTLIDSGSSKSFIDKIKVQSLNLRINPTSTQSICMASKSCSSETLGSVVVNLEIGGTKHDQICIQVMENLCCDMIIGHDILSLYEKIVLNFGGESPPLIIDNISKSAFSCALSAAKIHPLPLFEHLYSDVKPIVTKSRRFSTPDKQFIDSKIENLLSDNVIEPSSSPWRAQVMVTKNENHRPRLVIDYSQTINKFTKLDAYPLPNIHDIVHKAAQYTVFSSFDLKSAYHQVPLCEADKVYTGFEASGRLYQFTRIPFGVTNGVAVFQRIIDTILENEAAEGCIAYLDNIIVGGDDQASHDLNVAKFMEIKAKYGLTLNEEKTISSVQTLQTLGYLISKGLIRPDPDRLQPLLDLPLPYDKASLKRVLGLFSYYSQWISKFSDKMRPLNGDPDFPLGAEAVEAFELIKKSVADACVVCPNNVDQLVIETDASGYALSATLNQNGKPVGFYSRTLNVHEKHHSPVEKEACAIVEACRKWHHFIAGRKFLLVTDQEAVSFLFNKNRLRSTAKNDKIMRWRVELSCLDFDIKFRPGTDNPSADCISRAYCAALSHSNSLIELHVGLCHPGVVRMNHYVKVNNLPFSINEIKQVTSQCKTCAELKPAFFKTNNPPLIKASKPLERIAMDFKGPLPSSSRNKYLLTIVDEYSRFPFAFPCPDMLATTVKSCLIELFAMFGQTEFVHSDRGRQFLSETIKEFLLSHGICSSFSSSYNPRGNGQCERYNGIIWKTVLLALKSKNLDVCHWEVVLPEALNSIRSLLCTSTNQTPHERFLGFPRRQCQGQSLPDWIVEKGKVLLKRHVKSSKYDENCDEVDLIDTNPSYARVRLANGTEKTVSLRDLAPIPQPIPQSIPENNTISDAVVTDSSAKHSSLPTDPVISDVSQPKDDTPTLRKSLRKTVEPDRLQYDELGGG